MKRNLSSLFFLIVVPLMLVSCSIDHRGPDSSAITSSSSDDQTEWTILFYGAGNNAGDLLPNGQSQTFAIVHGLQNVYTANRIHAVALAGTEADAGRCRFYDIQFQPGEAGNYVSSASTDWGQQDMSSPQLLKQFVDSATAKYPAQHYALIIGGEGDAWRGACRDNANGGRVMSMPAIYQSIDASTSHGLPVHFDVLLWLTPGMGTMEVAYEMRGKVDYMAATSSILPQPGFLATSQWLLDLAAAPTISAERLGQFMVARMDERALAANDTLSTYNLFDLRSVETLAQDVSDMADSMNTNLQGRSSQILQVWQSLWDAQVSDSSSIDLSSFVGAIRTNSDFYSIPGIHETTDRVQAALDQVMVYRRSTRAGSLRKGLAIYSPMVPSESDLEAYNALQMSNNEPGWAGLLTAMQESGSALVQLRGKVTWAGHTLQNLYVFLNTAEVGAPNISLISPVSLTNIITPDNAEFQAAVALNGDSTAAYLGVFQDMDNNQQLSTGDRYGYFHRNATPQRDWIVIHSGDALDSLHIDLNRTQ